MTDKQFYDWLESCDYPEGETDQSMGKKVVARIKQLKNIIARCPNENDDLGAEFTHVQILKEKLEKIKKICELDCGFWKTCGCETCQIFRTIEGEVCDDLK